MAYGRVKTVRVTMEFGESIVDELGVRRAEARPVFLDQSISLEAMEDTPGLAHASKAVLEMLEYGNRHVLEGIDHRKDWLPKGEEHG